MTRFLIILLWCLLLPLPALAAVWQVDAAKSSIEFTALYGTDEVKGSFPEFSASINFDPEQLETSTISVEIPLETFATEDDDAKENLAEEDWFDVAEHPTATFVSSDIQAAGGNRYVAHGTLTLKGISAPLTLPFTLTLSEDKRTATAESSTRVSRLAYKIGEGEWETSDIIKDDVKLRIHIQATAKEE